MKIFFLSIFFCNICVLSQAISFLRKNNSIFFEKQNYFWYLKFFNLDNFSQISTKNIQVVIIDGISYKKNSRSDNFVAFFKKINAIDKKMAIDAIDQKNKNLSLCLMQKKLNFEKIIKKYHADITSNLIQQISPQANISVISVLNEHAITSKLNLHKALKKALQINPDILHLGLQIIDFNPNLSLDKQILKILKKFKCVVAPVGNNGFLNECIGFPANCSFVISVASFKQEGNRYIISNFCQLDFLQKNSTKKQADFIMPGENLLAEIWITELNDYFFIPVSGTSMAAALMTGQIAYLLEKVPSKNKLKSYDIKKILKKSSIYLDDSWPDFIRYGIPVL